MPVANILQGTFRIQYNNSTGTAFVVDVDDYQYLITARHVVSGFNNETDSIFIYNDGKWVELPATVIFPEDQSIDIAVLATNQSLSIIPPLPTTSDGSYIGSDVFFVGFPYGLSSEFLSHTGFPIPLVKKGLISGFGHQVKHFLLDGHNNPGFSGGPILFSKSQNMKEFQIIGVISGYRFEREYVWDKDAETKQFINSRYAQSISN
jgi:S1-C subfamily serine protease